VQNGQKEEILPQSGNFQRYLSCPRVPGQDFNELPTDEDIMSFFKELGHTGEISQSSMLLLIRCINLRELLLLSSTEVCLERQPVLTSFIFLELKSFREESQFYRARLPVSMTSPEMRETKAYKTYLVSPKDPTRKSKRVKRPAKKSNNATTIGVVIRDTHVMSLSKKKEKERKGIDLLSELALTKEAQIYVKGLLLMVEDLLLLVSYMAYLMRWIRCILQSQTMVLNSSKSWDTALQRMYAKGLLLLVKDLMLLNKVVSVVHIVSAASIIVNTVSSVVQPVSPITTEQKLARKNNLKAREQYFLMTDYSLWEVILNGDSPIPTKVTDDVVQPVAPITAEQRLQKLINQLEILRESLSQEDVSLKFIRSLPTKGRIHTLIWRNRTDLEDQSFDDLFNSLKIYEAEVKISSSTSSSTQNITFVSSQNTNSTNELVSAVTSVSAASTKITVSALPNMDTLSDAIIYSFFSSQSNSPRLDNDDLKQIDADDLEEIDLKWQMAMSPKDNRNKETQRRNVPVETSTSNALVSQCNESVEARILVYQQNETIFEEYIKLLKLDVQLRDNALVELRKKFEKAEQQREDLKLKLDKFQASSKNLSQLLASQTNDKTGLGYDNQVFNSFVFDCNEFFSLSLMLKNTKKKTKSDQNRTKNGKRLGYENQVFNSIVFDFDELISSESDVSMPTSPVHDMYQSSEGYHAVPPPYTRTLMPPKPDLVFHDALTINETIPSVFNVEPSTTKPYKDMSQLTRPSTLIIKDWVSDLEDESKGEPMPTQKAPSFFQTSEHVKTPRASVKLVEHPTPAEHLRKEIPKSKDTECIVLSSDFKLPDENHMLLRVPRENNMYNVDLKNIVPLGDLTCLFKATLDESNLWHRRLGHINFKTMNKLERIDNGTEFKNHDLNQFFGMKGIKREFSVARTPQQNRITERKNRTLVKDNQENDKIRSKLDKNGKRGEAKKSQKQLQSRKKEKLKKMQVEGPKMQTPTKFYGKKKP
nr:ribonuclease H-like domain-containing protein [Tanacetum cinerariifolium]